MLLAAALLVAAHGLIVVRPGEVAVPVLFGAVQFRRVLSLQPIRDAVADKLKAQEYLERQRTPTAIAAVLGALADRSRADALVRATESDKVRVLIMEGAPRRSCRPRRTVRHRRAGSVSSAAGTGG